MSSLLTKINDSCNQLSVAFNKRSERERIAIVLIAMGCIFAFWLFCLILPLSKKQTIIQNKLQDMKKNVYAISDIYNEYQLFLKSPSKTSEAKIKALDEKLIALQHHPLLAKKIIDTPEEMKNFLQAISKTGTMLNLNQAQKLTAAPMMANNTANLFNQKIAIELDGSYFETIKYLEYLEKLPWYLSFDSLDYQVEQYPNAKIKIIINALGTGANRHS